VDLEGVAKLLGSGAAGAVVVVTFLFVRGYVVPGAIYRKMEERAEKAEAKLWDTFPVLHQATTVMGNCITTMQAMADALKTQKTGANRTGDREAK
jgi:hypothetical protein